MNAIADLQRCAIRRLWRGVDVAHIRSELLSHPELWNSYKVRLQQYAHSEVADIWVRYNAWRNYHGDLAKFNEPHEAEWYPAARVIPALRDMALDVMRMVEGVRLGGVLITKVPPGGQVHPHIDRGWHAQYYDKIAVQIQADERQAFCFDDEQLVTATGDIYTFDNSLKHWVTNASDVDRITLIICVRLDVPRQLLWTRKE